jgi:hypothetical protein
MSQMRNALQDQGVGVFGMPKVQIIKEIKDFNPKKGGHTLTPRG